MITPTENTSINVPCNDTEGANSSVKKFVVSINKSFVLKLDTNKGKFFFLAKAMILSSTSKLLQTTIPGHLSFIKKSKARLIFSSLIVLIKAVSLFPKNTNLLLRG